MKINALTGFVCGMAMMFGSSAAFSATEISVWCWDDAFNVVGAKMAAERYEAKHPDVKVKVLSIGQPDIIQKLNASLGAKNVRGLPDVVLIEDYRVQNFLTGYPDFLKDLSNVIDSSKFVDYKIAASSYEGKHYGVPFDSGITVNYLRTDILEKAGLKVEDFENITWDKYLEYGKQIKEKTGAYLFGFDPNDLGIVRVMMQSAGMWYTDENGKINVKNNPALKEALLHLKAANDAGLVLYYSGWNQLLNTFQQSKVASVLQGCWITPSIKAAQDQSGKWRIVPLPKLNQENATSYSNLGGSQWYVNNYSKNADEAANFLKETFASDTELLNDLVTKIALVNSMKDSTPYTNYNVEEEFFGGQKIYDLYSQWNGKIPAISYGPHTYAVENIMTEALQRIFAGEDIDQVLEDTQINAEMQTGVM